MTTIVELQSSIKKYRKRFIKAAGVVEPRPASGTPIDPYILASVAALHLLVRAKYLFLATLYEDDKRNAYACYVLVRAYFETCMALGFLAIKLGRKSNKKDLGGIWKLAHRILQGGKHFPGDVFLRKTNKGRIPAINVYDFIEEVDKDLRRVGGIKGSSAAPHKEAYDTVLSEFGHPNHLGLCICSCLRQDASGETHQEIHLTRARSRRDRKNYMNFLDWGSLIFFHYWDKLMALFRERQLELPYLR